MTGCPERLRLTGALRPWPPKWRSWRAVTRKSRPSGRPIATLDGAVLAAYGGLNEAVARCAALETNATATTRVKPMNTTRRAWRSRRVPK